ncbi:MAG: 4-phosphoerythronate dehydrogenase [Muribaculaceae bacterium]|nr:4-phosphoerythronate dehydrogenase [Muribaculaceae bacterium]
MKIVVDDKIPFIRGVLEPFGEVTYLPAEGITRKAVADADALFIRTRTRIDGDLLDGSRVRFVATATIGLDHINFDYCRLHGIFATNAPGCNAPAVAQYVLASVAALLRRENRLNDIHRLTFGIVGVGHVGKIVEKWCRQLDIPVLLNDPPRAEAEGSEGFVSLDEIAAKADVITFHTPLTRDGKYPSWHLADADFFTRCKRRPIIVNAARGPVADTDALIAAIDSHKIAATVIDCWEGEPQISVELLRRADIATPHIAGYSLQGKIRATTMCLDFFRQYFGIEHPIEIAEKAPMQLPDVTSIEQIADSYDPFVDMRLLLDHPDDFENLRDFYNLRNEVN